MTKSEVVEAAIKNMSIKVGDSIPKDYVNEIIKVEKNDELKQVCIIQFVAGFLLGQNDMRNVVSEILSKDGDLNYGEIWKQTGLKLCAWDYEKNCYDEMNDKTIDSIKMLSGLCVKS